MMTMRICTYANACGRLLGVMHEESILRMLLREGVP